MSISNTLDYTPLYTNSSVKGTLRADLSNPMTVYRLIEKCKLVFNAASISTTATALIASGRSEFPFGFPFVAPGGSGSTPADCGRAWLTVDGIQFSAYNPYTQTAGLGPCKFFAWGLSPLESLQNLAAAVTTYTRLNATASGSGPYFIDYVGKSYGPSYNFIPIIPDGEWGFGGQPDGGGYEFETTLGATIVTFQLYGINGGWDGGLLNPHDGRAEFNFLLGGGKKYDLDTKTFTGSADLILQYTILANPHGFCIFDPTNDNHSLADTSLLFQAPKITEFSDCTSLAFIINPRKFRDTTSQWQSCTVYRNGTLTSFSDGPYPQPLALRSPGPTALRTLAGVPVFIGTYLFMGSTSGDTRKVCAKMWDCIMLNEYVSIGMTLNGKKLERVSAQTGTTSSGTDTAGATFSTRSSVLWGYDAEV